MKQLPTRLDDPPDDPEKIQIPTGPDEWYHFALSYKHAADCLASAMLRQEYREVTAAQYCHTGLTAVAPMMFLYRHYLELHLKSLLKDAGDAVDDPQQIPPRHYLLSLWHRVRPLLLRMRPEADGVWFDRADEVIDQMDSLDPTSFAFRYPVDTSGSASLRTSLSVHPVVVKFVIDELHLLLDGASLTAEGLQFLKAQGRGPNPSR